MTRYFSRWRRKQSRRRGRLSRRRLVAEFPFEPPHFGVLPVTSSAEPRNHFLLRLGGKISYTMPKPRFVFFDLTEHLARIRQLFSF